VAFEIISTRKKMLHSNITSNLSLLIKLVDKRDFKGAGDKGEVWFEAAVWTFLVVHKVNSKIT
jgi:hypothetical protein